MKNTLVIALLVCAVSTLSFGQQAFNNCSAAFLGNKMIVDHYTPRGTCSVSAKATGALTVNTVDLSPTESKAVQSIPFIVAIRDKNSQTLTRFSKQEVKRVNIQNILTNCRKGDHIVLLTVDKQYALPHNEILVR